MDFSSYSVRDFVLTESFQKWILDPDEETKNFWEDWLRQHPEKAETITEARNTIQNLRCAIEKNIKSEGDELWTKIMKDISDQ